MHFVHASFVHSKNTSLTHKKNKILQVIEFVFKSSIVDFIVS